MLVGRQTGRMFDGHVLKGLAILIRAMSFWMPIPGTKGVLTYDVCKDKGGTKQLQSMLLGNSDTGNKSSPKEAFGRKRK